MSNRASYAPLRRSWWVAYALVVVSLGVLYGPSLLANMTLATDPRYFHEDAPQHLVPFLRYGDAPAFRDDYASTYYLACLPVGYRRVFSSGAVLWDPIALSKALPYVGLL